MHADSIEQTIRTNLLAPMLLTRALLPSMLARGSGTVLNVSSMCACVRYFLTDSSSRRF